MATFSVKTGGSSSYGAALKLDITQGTQNIANNTTVVNYRLYLSRDGGYSQMWANGAYRRTVTVDGTSVVNTTGNYSLSTSSEYTLASGSRTVNHNSDGTKTVTVSGSFTGIAIHGGTTNISGSLTLTTIPRASGLTAFSFASNIKPSTAVTINYTVSRKNSGFRHDVTLLDGSTTIGTWSSQSSNGASTVSLPWQNVNTLLNRMSNVTSKTLTLRVQTKSGSTNIGSAVSRTAVVGIDSSVVPYASKPTISIDGSGTDKTMGLYVQSISKVSASSSGGANGGASLNGISITVRRKTSNTDTQVINAASGTTKNPVSLSGTYEAFATATDSRGRTSNSPTIDFTVEAYAPPVVSAFTADRLSDDASIVSVYSLGEFSSLSRKNTLTISIQRRTGTGAWSTMGTNTTSNTGSYVRSQNIYNNNVATSYEYRVLITDTFGNEAVSTVSVATQKVLFEFNEDKGIGIGKRHEHGILDVDGDTYFKGNVNIEGDSYLGGTSEIDGQLIVGKSAPANAMKFYDDSAEMSYISFHYRDESRKGWIGYGSSGNNKLTISNEKREPIELLGDSIVNGNLDITGTTTFTGGIGHIRVTRNQDLNSITTAGFYYCSLSADANYIKNTPESRAFSLTVTRHAGVNQIFTTYDTNNFSVYTRNLYGGNWGSWRKTL